MKDVSVKVPELKTASALSPSARVRPFEQSPNNPVRKTVGVYERPAARRRHAALIALLVIIIFSAIVFVRCIF